MKKKRGSVTLLVIIALIPLLILSLFTVDVTRLSYAKNLVSQGNELVLNAQLTRFNRALKDTYGLFAANTDMSKDDIKKEYAKILINVTNGQLGSEEASQLADAVVSGNGVTSTSLGNKLGIQIQNIEIKASEKGNLKNQDILLEQILEHMKYRGPVSIGYGFFDKFKVLESVQDETKAAEKKLEFEEKRETLLNELLELYTIMDNYFGAQSAFKTNILDNHENLNVKDTLNKKFKSESLPGYIHHENYSYQDTLKDLGEYGLSPYNGIHIFDINDIEEEYQNIVKEKKHLPDKAFEKHFESLAEKYYGGLKTGNCKLSDQELTGTLTFMPKEGKPGFYPNVMNIFKKLNSGQCSEHIKTLKLLNRYGNAMNKDTILITVLGKEYELRLDLLDEVNSKITYYIKNITKDYKKILSDHLDRINDYYKTLPVYPKKIIETGELLQKKLDRVSVLVSEVNIAHSDWSKVVEQLPEGATKNQAQQDVKASLKDLTNQNMIKLRADIDKDIENANKYLNILDSLSLHHIDRWNEELYGVNKFSDFSTSKTMIIDSYLNKTSQGDWIVKKFKEMNVSGLDSTEIKKETKLINENDLFKLVERLSKKYKDKKEEAKKNSEIVENQKKDKAEAFKKATSIIGEDKIAVATGGSISGGIGELESGGGDSLSTLRSAFSSLGTIFSKLVSGNIDNLFSQQLLPAPLLMEYGTEHFSDHLDTLDSEKCPLSRSALLSGKSINKNLSNFGAESEYLLYGESKKSDNIGQAKNEILLMRFGLNFAYSFTDSEITSSIAVLSAPAGPFAPLVKFALHVVVALAESYNDVNELLSCKEVPLYKSARTWVFKPTGGLQFLGDKAIQWASDTTQKGIHSIFGIINDKTKTTKEEIQEAIKNQIDTIKKDTIDSAKNQIQNEVLDPIHRMIEEIQLYSDSEKAKAYIEEVIEEVKNAPVLNQEAFSPIRNKIISILESKVKPALMEFAEKITEINSKFEDAIAQVQDSLNVLSSTVDEGVEKIRDTLLAKIDDMHSQINGVLQKAEKKTIEKSKEAIAKIYKDYKFDSASDIKAKNNTNKGIGIAFSYREYLKLFMLLRSMDEGSGRNNLLGNISKLIEYNVNEIQQTEEAYASMKDKEFKFENYSSVFEIKTTFKTNTLFMGDNNIFSKMISKDAKGHHNINSIKFGNSQTLTVSSILGH